MISWDTWGTPQLHSPRVAALTQNTWYLGVLGISWDCVHQRGLCIPEYLVCWDARDIPGLCPPDWSLYPRIPGVLGYSAYPRIVSAREVPGSHNTWYPGILGNTQDCVHQRDSWIPEYLVPWGTWDIPGMCLPERSLDPTIPGALGYSGYPRIVSVREVSGSKNTWYSGIFGISQDCARQRGPLIPEFLACWDTRDIPGLCSSERSLDPRIPGILGCLELPGIVSARDIPGSQSTWYPEILGIDQDSVHQRGPQIPECLVS